MITRIELHNFMSHALTVIEPAAGLTVLVGPNNVGKSAIVAALKILCRNENSTYVMRHGERECAIILDTDDGHHVEWRRKNSPSYLIDGQKFDRLRQGGLPDELHKALRLPTVDSGEEDDFDVHFGTQKSPIFLLNSSPSVAARFFASSSDAIRLVEVQRRHKEKLAEAQREKNRCEAESKQLHAELETLEPIVDVDTRLRAAEHDYEQLSQQAAWLQEAADAAVAMAEQAACQIRHHAQTQVLVALKSPPALEPTEALAALPAALQKARRDQQRTGAVAEALVAVPTPPKLDDPAPLERLMHRIARGSQVVERGQAEASRLAALAGPPQLEDAVALRKLIDRCSVADRTQARTAGRGDALLPLAPPPPPADAQLLETLVTRFEGAAKRTELELRELGRIADELSAAEQELRAAAAQSTCRLCGSPLDPDRVLARASGGLARAAGGLAGGHDHA